jgi:NitT/TauT family transport system ATP-binding protein
MSLNGPSTERTDAVVSIQTLSKVYPSRNGAVPALDQVSLDARAGEFVSVLGPSGCGKSTMLMIVAGLISRSGGVVRVNGAEVKRPLTETGIVFQSHVLLEWRTALGNVMLQTEARGLPRKESEQKARELLARVGLAGFEDKYPYELSGGMRQRVSICRALIHDPPLLLMDEPFGALDALVRDQMALDLQRVVSDRRLTVLFVTHSITEAVFLSDRVIVMTPRPGKIDRVIDVRLPRPRSLMLREGPEFNAYVREITELFLARGVLREDN